MTPFLELEEKLDQHLYVKLQGIRKPRVFSGWRHALRFATVMIYERITMSSLLVAIDVDMVKSFNITVTQGASWTI